jgi:hypothetical protein
MKRRWFQYRLRTMFVLLTLASVVTGVVQHIRHVRSRIQFHQAKALTCEERFGAKNDIKLMVLKTLRSSINETEEFPEVVQIVTNPLPEGHLLFVPYGYGTPVRVRRSILPDTEVEWDRITHVIREREQEASRIQDAQLYHQEMAERYLHALWRPWLRVAEDRSREFSDVPPAEMSPRATPQSPAIPALSHRKSEQMPSPSQEPEAPQLVPEAPQKIHRPWQPIDRPIPHDFDYRDLQLEKSAAA